MGEKPASRLNTLLKYGGSLAVAAVCLWLAARDVDLRRVWEVLSGASPWRITLAGLMSLAVSAVHCTKIQVLLARVCRLRFRTVFSAELVSILVDIVLPLRLLELMRAYIIGRGAGLRPSLVLGVQVVEKVVEVPFLMALVFLLGLTRPIPDWARTTMWGGLSTTAVLVIFLVLAVARPALLSRPIRWLGARRLPGAAMLSGILEQILEGMRLAAARPLALTAIVGITFIEWSVLAAALWVAASSIGMLLSPAETLGLLIVNFVAGAVPSSSSAALGIYEFTGKTMMTTVFGMQAERALALVVLAHGTLIGFGMLGGVAGLFLTQVSLDEIRKIK